MLRHGTRSGYTGHKCRGDACCAANTAYHFAYRKRRAAPKYGPPLAAGDPRHGTLNAYNYHRCRCPACSAANSAWKKVYASLGRPCGVEPSAPGEMALAPCWCEQQYREIPISDVRAGITWSCGPDCGVVFAGQGAHSVAIDDIT